MRRRLLLPSLALVAFAFASDAFATTNHTITVDGKCADWDPDEKLPVRDSTQTWVTWDATNLYFNFLGGADATQRRVLAIDVDPGISDSPGSITYSGVTFGGDTLLPEYVVEVTNGTVYFNVRSGATWNQTINPPGILATFSNDDPTCKIGASVTNAVEIAIPRASLVGAIGPQSLPPSNAFAFASFFFDPSASYVYGAPAFNGSDFGACDPSGTAPQTFFAANEFPSSDLGRAPNAYGAPLSFTRTALVSATNPASFGQTVTFTATVTRNSCDPASPTGSVNFLDGTTSLGTGNVDLATGQASLDVSTLPSGTHAITAVYSGDNNFATSTSNAVSEVVKAASTTTTLGSSSNPSTFGSSVTFTVAVSSAGGTPSGTARVTEGSTTLASGPLDGSGKASFNVSSLSVGSHTLVASFDGTTTFAASSSTSIAQVVNAAGATAKLTASSNPSTYGDKVTFTATVAGVGGVTPTGSVTFLDGSSTIGSQPLSSGTAALNTSSLSAGSHVITATYGGDSHYGTANAQVTETVDVAPSSTSLALLPTEITLGGSTVLTAKVTSTAAGVATGKVTFSNGTTALGSDDLDGTGTATFTFSPSHAGVATIHADYAGDSSFAASTSADATLTIDQATTLTSLSVAPNPANEGDNITFIASTTSSFPGSRDGSTVSFEEGATILGVATISGTAVFSRSLPVGTHSIVARFQGSHDYASSVSSPVSVIVNGPDAGVADTGVDDSGAPDAATDASTVDASADATSDDAADGGATGGDSSSSSGCGCFTAGGSDAPAGAAALFFAIAAFVSRRRARP